MPTLNYGITSFDRNRGNFPEIPVINMIFEDVQSEPGQTLQSRPGLVTASTMGTGPIKQLFQADGILNGSLFGVSQNDLTVFKGSTSVGQIAGDGYVSMAGFENRLFLCAGQQLWTYDDVNLSTVAFPEGSVLHICIGTSRLIAIEKNTGKVYWSNVLSPTIDALSFATAEASPDRLKHLLFIGDTLILFGTETVEFWVASSANPDLPFQPVVGRVFSIGIRDTGCATSFASTFAWITNKNQICAGDPQNIISNPSLDEKLANSFSARLWTFRLEGVEFLAVTLDDQTWVLSSTTKAWSTFESYGQSNWIPHCAAGTFMGSSIDGSLAIWSDDHTDFGGILERRGRAGLALDHGTIPIYRLTVRCNPGQTPYLTGTYSDPQIGVRVSRDGGFTWTPYYDRSLGKQGDYRNFAEWRSLGFAGRPGLLVEFRVTDPVPFRLSNFEINEAYGQV